MQATGNYESKAGRRRGYLYSCGTEALMFDLVQHAPSGRKGIVWAVNMGGKLMVRWADMAIGERVPGKKQYASLSVYNVRFIKRDASLREEAAA